MEENSIEIVSKPRSLVLFEKYMLVMGIVGQMIYYMQGLEIFLNRSAQDVSIIGFSMGLIAVLSWLTYGVLIKNRVLVIANIFGVIGALFVLAGILIYR
jgi:MtN3 and saliva related transmembrane protein